MQTIEVIVNDFTSTSMKRKAPPPLTLWDAAHVMGHANMWTWWKDCVARKRNLSGQNAHDPETVKCGIDVRDVRLNFPKTCNKSTDKDVMSTYTVAIRPTYDQKKVLRHMLRVSNAAYNWCLWLVKERNVKPSLFDLQKIVCRANIDDVPSDLLAPNVDFIFSDDSPHTTIRLTACKTFATHYRTAMAKTKNKAKFKSKDIRNPIAGSFCVQKQYIRTTTEKDWKRDSKRRRQSNYISLLPTAFGPVSNPSNRFLRLSKKVDRIPPIDHDVRVTLRPDGRFVLRIPCDSKYTRVNKGRSSDGAICGADPGSRSFVTVFDETRHEAYQLGTKEDRKEKIRSIQKVIDEQHERLSLAVERKHQQEIDDRRRAIKKLWFRMKNKVDAIHAAVASHLVRSFDLVSLGKINVKSIVKKKDKGDRGRELPKRAKRDLLAWRHYDFRLRLQHRASGTPCTVVIQDESYTSKKCGVCKHVNGKLGSSETFACSKCNYEVHRDINGARNILQKTLNIF